MDANPFSPSDQPPRRTPQDPSFPAVSTVLGGYDFHSYAASPPPAAMLRGESAGIVTSQHELLEAARHRPDGLPLRISSASSKARKLGLSLAASFLLFLAGGMYGAHASFYPDVIGLTVVFVSVAAFFAAVYFGLGMVYRVFAGPEMDHEATRRAVEQHTGIPLSELPLIYVGQRRLPPDEQVLLPQMCGLYNLLAPRGVPMPVHQWRSLTQLAVDALRQHHISGDLAPARSVGTKIGEWVQASEAALHSRTEFTNRGIIPPPF